MPLTTWFDQHGSEALSMTAVLLRVDLALLWCWIPFRPQPYRRLLWVSILFSSSLWSSVYSWNGSQSKEIKLPLGRLYCIIYKIYFPVTYDSSQPVSQNVSYATLCGSCLCLPAATLAEKREVIYLFTFFDAFVKKTLKQDSTKDIFHYSTMIINVLNKAFSSNLWLDKFYYSDKIDRVIYYTIVRRLE